MYLIGRNFPELAGFSENEKREILRRAWHERRGYLYLTSVLVVFIPGFGHMVERYQHLSIALIMLIGGLMGAVFALIFLFIILNTAIRAEVRKIAAETYNKSFKTDAGDAGAA